MGKYILKRVLQFIPVFIGVTMILFAMKAIVPGDPVKIITGGKQVTPETELQIRISNGLIETDEDNKPIYDENGDTIPTPLWKQYLTYMNDLLHGDLGTSYTRNMKVADILADKYPNTVKLAIVAIIIEAIVGIGAGMVSAIKRYSFWDVLVTLVTSILVAMPAFWLGMLLQLFFGVFLKNATDGAFYLPISGAGGSNSEFESWVHYILPAVTLAAVSTAYTARIMRSQLLEVLNQDYIRTAKAKGLSRSAIIWHHALKNALIPVVTYIGIDFGGMLAGAILTETVFNWPGVGYEIYRAVTQRDWPIVLGGVTVIVIVVMVINLLVDISYAFLDPRIRFGAPKDEG
ncbi:ABC transporter permease [uncultured Parolsenella sp.]|uniref:ABC transporter permease n=1 Tax=uncultured Parolsenella sp. TaxID=2083008 RepID=UPI0027DE17F1|nr:ABC transporter permease [uncultured Parolsenella sp.]